LRHARRRPATAGRAAVPCADTSTLQYSSRVVVVWATSLQMAAPGGSHPGRSSSGARSSAAASGHSATPWAGDVELCHADGRFGLMLGKKRTRRRGTSVLLRQGLQGAFAAQLLECGAQLVHGGVVGLAV